MVPSGLIPRELHLLLSLLLLLQHQHQNQFHCCALSLTHSSLLLKFTKFKKAYAFSRSSIFLSDLVEVIKILNPAHKRFALKFFISSNYSKCISFIIRPTILLISDWSVTLIFKVSCSIYFLSYSIFTLHIYFIVLQNYL